MRKSVPKIDFKLQIAAILRNFHLFYQFLVEPPTNLIYFNSPCNFSLSDDYSELNNLQRTRYE